MKKILLTIIIVSFFVSTGKAQLVSTGWSIEGSFSPSTSTLIGDASRISHNETDWSMFYMLYNDSSYFCTTNSCELWGSSPVSYKTTFPKELIISHFTKVHLPQGFVGSYFNEGMLGWPNISPGNIFFFMNKFSAVNRLTRMVSIREMIGYPVIFKGYAIGEIDYLYSQTPRSCILEFYSAHPAGNNHLIYHYIPMAFDSVSNIGEFADDVITVDHYVVYSTRDTRYNHAPVNLRISDTSDAFLNPDIDHQWKFDVEPHERVVGKTRLVSLGDGSFVLAYVVNNAQGQYFLITHKIILLDFLSEINTITSHRIFVSDSVPDLTDVIYERDVKTMVILMNGENRSAIFHVDPHSTTSDYAYRLNYNNGNLYSIDTAGTHYYLNFDVYMAMGDSTILYQNISNGCVVEESCLEIKKDKNYLYKQPKIKKEIDILERHSGMKNLFSLDLNRVPFHGTRTCNVYPSN